MPVSARDEHQMRLAEDLYRRLQDQGAAVLLDDREERLGVKLTDADLIGIPLRIVVGKKAVQGIAEYQERDGDGGTQELTTQEIAGRILQKILGS
ncbi:hypothetical protein LJK88_12985 [Paenibacillus sp. P26]|nr:hypothetical protein LJK88_12985 [Paenibacillus sp. P26]